MAKQQDLPLAPSEISGVCGRLLCCLAYENELYAELKKSLPKVGSGVKTSHGSGVIVGLNVLTESVLVELPSEQTIEVKAEEIEEIAGEKESDTASAGGRTKRRR
jgi:cell fate regulator YaaT (PSP1 superfamily)